MIEGLVLLDMASVIALLFVILIGLRMVPLTARLPIILVPVGHLPQQQNSLQAIAPQPVLSLRSG